MAQEDLMRLREDVVRYRTLDCDDGENGRERERDRIEEAEMRRRAHLETKYRRRSLDP